MVPNLLAPDTPLGEDDEGNVELRREGDPVPADEARAHDRIGERLKIFDLARAAEVAGSGFYYWRGDGARLAWAIFSYAQDLLVNQGYEPMLTPLVARERTFFGTGYLPFFADQLYRVQDSDLSLISSSEQTLIAYYGDTIADLGSCRSGCARSARAFAPRPAPPAGPTGAATGRTSPQGRADRDLRARGLRALAGGMPAQRRGHPARTGASLIGERKHPVTDRHMLYVGCEATIDTARLVDADELAELAWCDGRDLITKIPSGLYEPVADYLRTRLTRP